MGRHLPTVDRIFLAIVMVLIVAGLIIFISASLGTMEKNEEKWVGLIVSQLLFGVIGGGISMYVFSRIKYTFLRKQAFWIFLLSIALSLCVFIPGLGMEHGGAKRWIDLGFTTFQPAELLKFGVIVYLATWLTLFHKRTQSYFFGIVPLLFTLGVTAGILLGQKDTGTFLVAGIAGTAMYLVAGSRWRDILFLLLIGIIGISALAYTRPYVRDRISTLIHLDDVQGSGYQIKQSLIAIGTGGLAGKGLGQSVQKFNYLPEAHGDSIFAVIGEELGFIGTSFIILCYLIFALRGLWISAHAPDTWSGLLMVGLVILIIAQSYINIGSMLALLPLTGIPLTFISHGGTALFVSLTEIGIMLNISRYIKN